MADRVQIIKELQEYYDREWIDERTAGVPAQQERKRIIGNALNLLNEFAYPVEPEVVPCVRHRYLCGNCGKYFDENDYYAKYCPSCGMVVKWDG